MPQNEAQTIRARAADFRKLADSLAKRQMDRMIGQNDEVVMESGGVAHTRQFGQSQMVNPGLKAGQFIRFDILKRCQHLLEAELRT